MPRPLHHSTAAFVMLFSLVITGPASTFSHTPNSSTIKTIITGPKIQAAILLDVSGSMNELIEQAKSQLWNMVLVMDKVKCENGQPKIEIALYEYGRYDTNRGNGYLKQVSGFTNDFDQLSNDLNGITSTQGSAEFCGQVIYTSLNNLGWDTSAASYKVIFIAGNEEFLQGNISYTQACTEAKKKGVIVNTIYCGNKERGINEHWNLGANCGNGSFTNIDPHAKEQALPTPYDSSIFLLNQQINRTYITYGVKGKDSFRKFTQYDTVPMSDFKSLDKVIAYKVVKSKRRLFNNDLWDLVDAMEKDSTVINKVDMSSLADSLKNKNREYLKQFVEAEARQRAAISKQIADMNAQRDAYIIAEKNRLDINEPNILKTAIERIIREQVKRFNMYIE